MIKELHDQHGSPEAVGLDIRDGVDDVQGMSEDLEPVGLDAQLLVPLGQLRVFDREFAERLPGGVDFVY